MAILQYLCILITISVIRAQQSCQTPDAKSGNCIVIQNCQKLNDILLNRFRTPSETRYLRNSQCGQEGIQPKVCCETAASSSSCLTPENDQGQCINIYKCQPIADLLKLPKPIAENVLNYLRALKCQGSDRFGVCCSGKTPSFTQSMVQSTTTPTETLLPEDCGVEPNVDKIVGGEQTGIDRYPWMAIVEYRNRFGRIQQSCGASLISKRFLVTAAHCVHGTILKQIGNPIRLGEYDRSNSGADCEIYEGSRVCSDEPMVIPIEKFIPHPQFETVGAPKNDIAVIKLSRDAPFTDFIRPICLPKEGWVPTSPNGIIRYTVAGWGTTDTGRASNLKLHLNIPAVDLDACQRAYDSMFANATLWEKQLCAGGSKGQDSCRGDSGGPLMFSSHDAFILAGVVSFGPTPCGQEGIPGVYSKVLAYRDWILEQMRSQ